MSPTAVRMPMSDLIIPTGMVFAYLGLDHTVQAFVYWDDEDGQVAEQVYAVNDHYKTYLPRPDSDRLAEEIYHLIVSERLVLAYEVVEGVKGVWTVDDLRNDYSYRVYTGEDEDAHVGRPHMAARTVYRFFDDDVHDQPPLTTYNEVMALVKTPGAKRFSNLSEVRDFDQTEGVAAVCPVVVFDISAMYEGA